MTHFTGLETVDLREEFAQGLLTDASCEAVVVESEESDTGADAPGRVAAGRGGRRVVVFRVGRAFVAEIVDVDRSAQHVGLAPREAEAYLDRVEGDEGWTVLWVDGPLASDRRGSGGAEASTRP